ncbi:MAG: hypothetical protein C0619_01140 [Desulfuromonas sp.]|nr:MAG: hypothetical protein C0619_01140 [Desulfuromonas sp.]
MSSILKALRKLEEEKAALGEGRVDLARDILKRSAPQRSSSSSLPLIIVFFGLLVIAGIGLLWWQMRPVELQPSLPSIPALAPAPAAVNPLPQTSVQPAAADPVPALPDPPAAPESVPVVVVEPAPVAAAEPAPIAAAVPAAAIEAEPAAVVDAEPIPVVAAETAPVVAEASAAEVETEPSTIVAEDTPPVVETAPLAVVPADPAAEPIQQPLPADLPQLSIDMILFKPEPDARLAVINDLPVMEGTVLEGVRIVEIQPQRVRISWQGEEFSLPLKQ